MTHKKCPTCQATKPVDEFYPGSGRNGLSGWCKPCTRAYAKKRFYAPDAIAERERKREERKAELDASRARVRDSLVEKLCRKCDRVLPIGSFHLNKTAKDGRQSKCKDCSRAWQIEQRDKVAKTEPDTSMKYKRCSKCGERLPVSQFPTNRRSPDGYDWSCRGCRRSYDQQRYWSESKSAVGVVTRKANVHVIAARRRENQHIRRVLKQAFGIFEISDKDLRRLVLSPCANCGTRENVHMDHIIPITRGGRHSIGNLQPLCLRCNSSKSDRLMVEWKNARKSRRFGRSA